MARIRLDARALAAGVALTMIPAAHAGLLCPNGAYVSRGPCTLCPDGRYVGAGSLCSGIAPSGYSVSGGRTVQYTRSAAPRTNARTGTASSVAATAASTARPTAVRSLPCTENAVPTAGQCTPVPPAR